MLFATSPFKERQRTSTSGALSAGGRVGHLPAVAAVSIGASPLGATYDAFDSERYVLTFDNRAFRDLAANAPYDVVEILVNSATYGGGGIFGLYSTVAADSAWAPYIFVHEFGHHFAGARRRVLHVGRRLPAAARSRRAVGAERDGAARSGGVEMEGSGRRRARRCRRRGRRRSSKRYIEGRFSSGGARSARRTGRKPRWTRCSGRSWRRDALLRGATRQHGSVGAFEGANYEARGFYRPQIDCIMFTRNRPVLRGVPASVTRIIDLYSRP